MKRVIIHPTSGGRRARRAFTLTELMVTMGIFMVVIAGVILCHVAGLKFFHLTASKLSATDGARRVVGLMGVEIRSAKQIRVGMGSALGFTEAADGTAQRGNAIQIYPTLENTNRFIRYYLSPTDQKLRRLERNASGQERVRTVAEFITNQVVFAAENYRGEVLTESQNNRVIRVHLQFYQIQYPVTTVGPGCLYDFYQLNTRITRRVIE